jgi:hypothetical protein
MTWNHDMTACPLGKEVTATRLVADKNSASGKTVRDFKEYQRDDVILASKCGKVIKSYWIPDEKRFAGFQPDEEIVAWMAWPSHPGTVSQEAAA